MIVFGWVEICSKMQKKFGQHIILLIYSSILELKFPAPYLNFLWAWNCLVGVALKTMEISSQTQQLHCTVVQKWIDYSAISDISSNGIQSPKRSIFQTFWRLYCVTKSLFFELETPNFGSSYVFSSPLNLRGQILPNLTFWTQKWHISLKSRYHYSKVFVSWDKCMTWNMRFLTFKCQVRKKSDPPIFMGS